MLDLHARDGDRMHSFGHSRISCDPSLFFRGNVLDPYQHRRLVEPKILTDLPEHGIRSAQYHQGFRSGFDQGSPHDGRSCRVSEDGLTDGLHLCGSFFSRGSGNDPASVDQKTVVDDVMNVVVARDLDSTRTLAGARRSDKSDNCYSCKIFPGQLFTVQDTLNVLARI